jgi:hypothetical protein
MESRSEDAEKVDWLPAPNRPICSDSCDHDLPVPSTIAPKNFISKCNTLKFSTFSEYTLVSPMRHGIEVDGSHVKYPAVFEAFSKASIALSSGETAQIVWWDGDIKPRDLEILGPAQRINKIPGMDYICFKSTTVHALSQMRRMFPEMYRFFPRSFLLPHQLPELQRSHDSLQAKTGEPVTWIVKPRNECCGHGIRLIQHISALGHKADSVVVQKYIPPFVIDGF